jgi:hypothetical protein
MSSYAPSFSTYLIQSTFGTPMHNLGNYSKNKLTAFDGYIVTIIPALNFLMMFFFYLVWKGHFSKCISDQEEDNADVKP